MHAEESRSEQHMRHAVELPDGRRVQVTYLELGGRSRAGGGTSATLAALPAPATAAGKTAREAGLHVCPRCAGRLVHPLNWSHAGSERWRLQLRCPDCGLWHEGVFGRAVVEELDEELDRATGALLGDLKRLTHANMSEEIELFARALELDLIGPDDFQGS
jgi:hypothetical protein